MPTTHSPPEVMMRPRPLVRDRTMRHTLGDPGEALGDVGDLPFNLLLPLTCSPRQSPPLPQACLSFGALSLTARAGLGAPPGCSRSTLPCPSLPSRLPVTIDYVLLCPSLCTVEGLCWSRGPLAPAWRGTAGDARGRTRGAGPHRPKHPLHLRPRFPLFNRLLDG